MFLQTYSELEEATVDLLQRLRKENVFYAEIRFCPSLHTLESLSSEEALHAVMKGTSRPLQRFFHFLNRLINLLKMFHKNFQFILAFHSEASRDGESKIYGGIIICALRSMSEEHGIEMADLAAKYLKVSLIRIFQYD